MCECEVLRLVPLSTTQSAPVHLLNVQKYPQWGCRRDILYVYTDGKLVRGVQGGCNVIYYSQATSAQFIHTSGCKGFKLLLSQHLQYHVCICVCTCSGTCYALAKC